MYTFFVHLQTINDIFYITCVILNITITFLTPIKKGTILYFVPLSCTPTKIEKACIINKYRLFGVYKL